MTRFFAHCVATIVLCMAGASAPAFAQSSPPAPASPQQSRAQQLMGDIAPKLADLTDSVLFGDVWARPQLSRRIAVW